MPKIAVKKLDERAVLPTYGSEFAAGADLYALLDEPLVFMPGETKFVKKKEGELSGTGSKKRYRNQ